MTSVAKIILPVDWFAIESNTSVDFFGVLTNSGSNTLGISYSWDFGDGSISTLQNPSHIFLNYGRPDSVQTVTLTVIDSYGATTTDQINNIPVLPFENFSEPRVPGRYHNFYNEQEDQFTYDLPALIKLGTPEVAIISEKEAGMNSYRLDRFKEKFPEVKQPLDSQWFYPGLRTLQLPIHKFDSAISREFDLNSPMSAFAWEEAPQTYTLEENTSGQVKALGAHPEKNTSKRMLAAFYYQPLMTSWVSTQDSQITFTINPTSGKIVVPTGDTLMDTIADRTSVSFWLQIADQSTKPSTKWDHRMAKFDSSVAYSYSFDSTLFSEFIHLDFYINQDHFQMKLFPGGEVEVNKNSSFQEKLVGWEMVEVGEVMTPDPNRTTLPMLAYKLTTSDCVIDLYLDPVEKTIQKLTNYYPSGPDQNLFYLKGSFLGNWFVKRDLPMEDQKRWVSSIGVSSFATLENISSLNIDSAILNFDSYTALQFPGTSYQEFPQLPSWNWSLQDKPTSEIFGDPTPFLVDTSTTSILTPLGFDDQRALPILITGSVTMLYTSDPFEVEVPV